MRPSKVIQQKCYRIVDLRQQRVKVLSNTKENDQFTNLNVANSQKSHNSSQKQNTAKSPINRCQTQQIHYKPGTSKSLQNANVSNMTPNLMPSQIHNQSIYTEFDGKYFQPSVFQFRTNNLYFNDSGVQSSRSQFVFSEKYSKNIQSKKLMASRDKNRTQYKGSFCQNQKSSNQQQQYDQQSLHKQNSEQNSKLKEYGMLHESSMQNSQIAFDQQSSRFNEKESKYLKDDNLSKANLTRSTYQNLNEDLQQQSTFADSSQQSQLQFVDSQHSKQLSFSSTARNIKSQVNCKTSQGFYNNSTSNELSKNQKKNIQKLNSYPYQNEFTEIQQKQPSFNFNQNNFDNQKSIIYKHPSNTLNTEQKSKQSSLAQDFLASTIKKKPVQMINRKKDIQNNSTNLNFEQETQQKKQQYIYQLNESDDALCHQLQNQSHIMRVNTSEDTRKHRKVSSNTVPLNKQQRCNNIYSQKNLEDCQKQNNMVVFNLSSRPSTANNLLIKNKIFRDETLNANLQRKQNKQNQKVFNSSVGIYLDFEDFTSQNTDQKNLSMSNYKSMILKNTLQPFDQSKEISSSQLNLKEDSKIETLKSNSVVIRSIKNKQNPSNVFPSNSELFNRKNSQLNEYKQQSEEAKKKQIDTFIGKIFKRSFFPDKNNLINKITTIFPKKQSLNCLNTTLKNQIFSENASKMSKTQRSDINRKILQNYIKKPVQQTEESSCDQLETQQSQMQNYLESYDNIQQQQDSNDQIQDPLEPEDEKDKDVVDKENPDDKYMILNQYFHQKYTQPIYYQNKKQSILNQISKTQCCYYDKVIQNSNRNYNQSDIEFYDKFEPWENDDKAINNIIDEVQE
ncbi:hypothetical protein ABPG74_022742 [Tetrahymena malaccensis]